MTGRFPSTVNGTTIRTSPARAIVRAFLFRKISVGGSERPGAGTVRSDAPDAYTVARRLSKTVGDSIYQWKSQLDRLLGHDQRL